MKNNLIINFHDITDSYWFESVIMLLKSKYTFVDLVFFENNNNYKINGGFCHITFDDGAKTFYNNAYPILIKHAVPATIFISPKCVISRRNFWFQEIRGYNQYEMTKILSHELSLSHKTIIKIPFVAILKCLPLNIIEKCISSYQKSTNTPPKACLNMNTDEILEVEKSGLITVGAHTLNHPILKNETDNKSHFEIEGSIKELSQLLRHEVRYFAYPNGIPNVDFSERELNFLLRNNIILGVSTEAKFISFKDNRLSLPRFGLSYGNIHFITIKLFFGSKWEKAKSFLRNSELKSRRKIVFLLNDKKFISNDEF